MVVYVGALCSALSSWAHCLRRPSCGCRASSDFVTPPFIHLTCRSSWMPASGSNKSSHVRRTGPFGAGPFRCPFLRAAEAVSRPMATIPPIMFTALSPVSRANTPLLTTEQPAYSAVSIRSVPFPVMARPPLVFTSRQSVVRVWVLPLAKAGMVRPVHRIRISSRGIPRLFMCIRSFVVDARLNGHPKRPHGIVLSSQWSPRGQNARQAPPKKQMPGVVPSDTVRLAKAGMDQYNRKICCSLMDCRAKGTTQTPLSEPAALFCFQFRF